MWEYEYANNPDELQHYGVKGMRWGVRKDIRILANSRRNEAVRKIKFNYKQGKIDKETRNASIKKANTKRNQEMDKMADTVKKAATYEQRRKAEKAISNQALKEVSSHKVKKGATFVADIVTGYRIGASAGMAIGGAITGNLPVAAIGVASMAGEAGARYLVNMGLDKLS